MATNARERTLALPPVPASAGLARRLVREVLTQARREGWRDAAELAVSELVTNAVLHAHTTVTITARCDAHELRVDVRDANPTLPSQRHYGEQATTGRGMALIAAVTTAHGVTALGTSGKVVWFSLADNPADPEPPDLLAGWSDQPDSLDDSTRRAQRHITLAGLQPTLWLAATQHHDALLRELALVRANQQQSVQDLAAADQARFCVRQAMDRALADAQGQARARLPLPPNHPTQLDQLPAEIDLSVEVPDENAAAGFALLQDVLDEAERLASGERLLARPGLHEIVAVRDWVCEQAISQLAGEQPSRWPGTAAAHFAQSLDQTERRLDWDPTHVQDSTRGVVAADEANRIVAISRPLADLLGWQPEDLIGRRVVAIVPPRFREAHVAGFTRHLTTGEAHALGVHLTLPVLHADATEFDCDFFIEAHRASSGRTVYLAWVTPLT